jgi:signal transduction histidine kinase
LGQVLDNLLGNAIKYAPPGGDIVVRVEATGDQARLSVADQGPGIPADALPRLFERFYRGQHSAGEGGLGLGLYISRMLVEAHGGAIRAASRPGTGSIFTVTLPRLGRAASERHTQQNADKSGPKP